MKRIQIHDENDYQTYFLKEGINREVEVLEIFWNDCIEIPDSIINYPNLKLISGIFSSIENISSNISELDRLEELTLHVKHKIPIEVFAIRNLKKLYVRGAFTFIPKEISELKKISSLEISGEHFRSIPDEITLLTNLKTLSITGDNLSNLPESIGLLKNIDELRLNSKIIEAFPQSFCKLNHLKELILDHDQLQAIWTKIERLPDYFNEFVTLEKFSITGYKDTQRLNELISYWAQLKYLSLTYCNLREVPEAIRNCKKLEFLNLDRNEITIFPKWISELTQLRVIFLGNNKINKIPADELFRLKNLDTLVLYNNNFSEKEKVSVNNRLAGKIFSKIFN